MKLTKAFVNLQQTVPGIGKHLMRHELGKRGKSKSKTLSSNGGLKKMNFCYATPKIETNAIAILFP